MATLTLDSAQTSLLDPVEEAERPRSAPAATQPRGVAAPAAVRGHGAATTKLAAGDRTLDDLVARTWSALRVSRASACLLCGGEVAPSYGSGPHPVGGTCRSCGTQIS